MPGQADDEGLIGPDSVMRLIIISGVSGSGKGVATSALEDLGYYTVDNVPLGLLPVLAEDLRTRDLTRAAVVVDARNTGADFERFPILVQRLRSLDVHGEVVFLDADDAVLLKRFSETRRRHPLTTGGLDIAEALSAERRLLTPLRDAASITVDTTHRSPHELRNLMRQRIDRREVQTLSLLFESFAFRNGVPPDADFVFDMRCLPNPHWVPELRALTGRDAPVQAFFEGQPALDLMLDSLKTFLQTWVPAFETDNRAYLSVAIGCTGGKHRSVYVAERLRDAFDALGKAVLLRHRELGDKP